MEQRQLGATGPRVGALGLGCMGMSGMYGAADRAEALATIRSALEQGPVLLDTGDFYGMGHNELLIREALAGAARERAVLSVKFGAQRGPDGAWLGFDGRPAAVKTALAYSLQRLGVDHIDIYRPARLDPLVPIEETLGALADLVQAGYIRHIGLSEVGAATLRRAAAVHPICDLQIEYSLIARGIEADILPAARALGIAITAYGVLSRGLLGGQWRGPRDGGDMRRLYPRFQAANLERNLNLVAELAVIAAARGMSPAQLAIGWVLDQGADIVALIGARRRAQWEDALAAASWRLDDAVRGELAAAAPAAAIAGSRYPAAQMAVLDSEKSAER